MSDRSFEHALRRADRQWAEEKVSPNVERELKRKLRGGANVRAGSAGVRRTGWLAVGGALAAATAMALWPAGELAPQPAAQAWAGFEAVTPCPGFVAHEEARSMVVDSGRCRLLEPEHGISMNLDGAASLQKTAHGVSVRRGHVVFEVESRSVRRQVVVSGGIIEIVGTRFVVDEQGQSGSVTLEEGSIRFLAPNEPARMLSPGQTLTWPVTTTTSAAPVNAAASLKPNAEEAGRSQPAASSQPPVTTATKPVPSAAATASSAVPARTRGEVIAARVAALRARGRYAEAAELLSQLNGVADEDRERLSYERGALLTYRVKDKQQACRHWGAHLKQFPNGRYGAEVRQATKRLACDSKSPTPDLSGASPE